MDITSYKILFYKMICAISTIAANKDGNIDEDSNIFSFGVYKDKNVELEFASRDAMKQFLEATFDAGIEKKKRIFIYGHRTDRDLYRLFKDDMKEMLINDRINMIRQNPLLVTFGKSNYMLDIRAFFVMDMPSLVKTLEMNDYIGTDMKKTARNKARNIYAAITYLKENIESLGYKPRKLLTAGQVTMTSYKTFVTRNHTYYHLFSRGRTPENEYNPLIRKAMRGGRMMAFKKGKFVNTYYYDQTAQHPYIESTMPFPDIKEYHRMDRHTEIPNAIGVTKCTIEAPAFVELPFPYLPITYKGEALYPNSCVMKGTWTNLELKKAISLGYILKEIEYSICFDECKANPFKEFIEQLWQIRKEKPKREQIVIKLLMNNLAMKFIQVNDQVEKRLCRRYEIDEWIKKGYEFAGVIDEYYIMKKKIGEYIPSYHAPIIPVMVTAISRDIIYDKLTAVGWGNALYCNTDGIITLGNQDKYFEIGDELGQWKKEQVNKVSEIVGENRYYCGDRTAVSGLEKSKQTKELISNREMASVSRTIGLKTTISTGNMQKLGSVKSYQFQITDEAKMDKDYPDYISEEE